MNNISLNIDKVTGFVTREEILALKPQVEAAQKALEEGNLPGNDFLGWLHLPSSITKEHIEDIKAAAQTLRENCEVVVVAGIGGSYLGARAVIEALSNNFAALINDNKNPRIIFAGHNISEDYLFELTEFLKDKKYIEECYTKSLEFVQRLSHRTVEKAMKKIGFYQFKK